MNGPLRLIAAVGLVAGLVVGCAASNDAPDAPTPTAPVTAGSSRPASEPTASAAPAPGEPGATLRGPGTAAAGTVGSWAIDGAGSDAPWLPASTLSTVELARNALVSIAFDDGAGIGVFSVMVAAAGDIRGQSPRGIRARDTARPPLAAIDLPPLPSGDWVLAAQLVRADDRGEATFYWSIHVP